MTYLGQKKTKNKDNSETEGDKKTKFLSNNMKN